MLLGVCFSLLRIASRYGRNDDFSVRFGGHNQGLGAAKELGPIAVTNRSCNVRLRYVGRSENAKSKNITRLRNGGRLQTDINSLQGVVQSGHARKVITM
jgi:hypothetical protein